MERSEIRGRCLLFGLFPDFASLIRATILNGPPRHEGRPQQRDHRVAALVGAGVGGLQDAPFRALLGSALRFDLAGEADGIAGQYRLEPAQLAKARRRSPDRDLLAARESLPRRALAIVHQQLHADRSDMPARCGEPAEQRLPPLFLVEMKALWIELRGEFLDCVGGEGARPQFSPLPDLGVLEEAHQPGYSPAAPARRATMIGETISHNALPAAWPTTPLDVTLPA